MKLSKTIVFTLLLGAALGALFMQWFSADAPVPEAASEPQAELLYWVAPMDPNYRRDKPGMSPMGMPLLAVYAEQKSSVDAGPGTIRISADVINNLGVRTVKVVRKPLQGEIKAVGYIQYDEDKLVHIHPRVEGWIEKLHVKTAGEQVTQGQPLYTLYAPKLVNAQEELLIAINRKNQRLIQAAEDRLKALQLPAEFIQELKKKRQVKQTVTFFSPQSGVVDVLNIREGIFVKPDTMLMSIGMLDDVWVSAEVFESQTSQVQVGQPVTMTLAYLPGKQWQGLVDYVYPTLDPVTRTAKIRLRFSNQTRELKPNMYAQVIIHAQSDKPTLVVPREAVIRTGSMDRLVLALGQGRFKSVQVKLGHFDSRYIEILEGVAENEWVVSSAQFLIDSESSKSSDFRRMNHGEESGSLTGVINSVNVDRRVVNISHEAIRKWNRPAMTMDFNVDENIELDAVPVDSNIRFNFVISNGQFVVTELEVTP